MIQKIEILDYRGEVVALIKHIEKSSYIYEQNGDVIYGVSLQQTPKGVWVFFTLLYVDAFKTFLSNKNINIIK